MTTTPRGCRGDAAAFKYTLWHQLDVVRTHLAFLADARERGDG